MTLKEFLESNGISATNRQRSVLGRLINTENNNPRVREDGYLVVNYDEEQLQDLDNINIIINYLNSES